MKKGVITEELLEDAKQKLVDLYEKTDVHCKNLALEKLKKMGLNDDKDLDRRLNFVDAEWGNVVLWIRDFGPKDAGEFNTQAIFGHAMVKVEETYYGFAPLSDDDNVHDVQDLNQTEFLGYYSGQYWNKIELKASKRQAEAIKDYYKYLEEEESVYRRVENNCSVNLQKAIEYSNIFDPDIYDISKVQAITPTSLVDLINIYDSHRSAGFNKLTKKSKVKIK